MNPSLVSPWDGFYIFLVLLGAGATNEIVRSHSYWGCETGDQQKCQISEKSAAGIWREAQILDLKD